MFKNLLGCCLLICFVLSISPLDSNAIPRSVYVTVDAGSHDRKDCVVSFAMPRRLKAKAYVLRDGSGNRLPLQVEPDGTATFVLPALKAGATGRFSARGS